MTTNQELTHVVVVLSIEEAKAILQSCTRGGLTEPSTSSTELDWYKDKKQYGSGCDSHKELSIIVYPQGMYAGCKMPIPYAKFVGQDAKELKDFGVKGRYETN